MKKVSIVIPTYNLEKYIAKTIESILSQTYSHLEILIIDDGSTDSTLQIVKSYEFNDHRIRVFSYGANKGPMYARQFALKEASGDFITFCDGDDILRNDYVELLVNSMTSEIDMAVGQFSYVLETGKIVPYHIQATLKYGNDKDNVFRTILRGEMPQGLCCKLFRAEIVKTAKLEILENCTRGEDACVLFHYIDRIRKATIVDESIYYYYQRSNSSTNSSISNDALNGICLTSNLRAKVLSNYPDLKRDEYRYFQQNLLNTLSSNCNRSYMLSCIRKYGLSNYCRSFSILRYSGPKMLIKFWPLRINIF